MLETIMLQINWLTLKNYSLGERKSYINASRLKKNDPLKSRLCLEQYTPGTTKNNVTDLEKRATILKFKSGLGYKSGQRNGDSLYRYRSMAEEHYEYQLRSVVILDLYIFSAPTK